MQRITIEKLTMQLSGEHLAYGALTGSGNPHHDDHHGAHEAFSAISRCSPRTKPSIAFANPSCSLELVTKRACRCTSGLAFPMAILSPLFLNINTSFGMSPMVTICTGGMDSACESTSTTCPLLASRCVTSR